MGTGQNARCQEERGEGDRRWDNKRSTSNFEANHCSRKWLRNWRGFRACTCMRYSRCIRKGKILGVRNEKRGSHTGGGGGVGVLSALLLLQASERHLILL